MSAVARKREQAEGGYMPVNERDDQAVQIAGASLTLLHAELAQDCDPQ